MPAEPNSFYALAEPKIQAACDGVSGAGTTRPEPRSQRAGSHSLRRRITATAVIRSLYNPNEFSHGESY